MKAFLDTSILVAGTRDSDLRYEASRALLLQSEPRQWSCAAHTLAELYATVTGTRPPNRFRPDQAVLILENMKARLHCIVLTADEVFDAIQRTASLKLPGGTIYDALILGCARKVNAECIYTWNEKHFKMVAPDLAHKIMTP